MKIFTIAGVGAILIGLAGCAHIPADRDRVSQSTTVDPQLAADIKLARDGWPAAQWWTAYGDLQLNGLINRALSDSPTVKVAATRIVSAHAALAANRADLGLQTDFSGVANRQRYSSNGLLPAPIGGTYYNEETLQVQAQYGFDWWGKNRAQVAAAVGEINARRADYAQAEQALAAAIAQSYFNLQGAWARSANMHRIAAAQAALVADKARRIAHGLAGIDEQRAAEADLARIAKQGAQLDMESARERESLRALIGADGDALADLRPQPIPDVAHAMPAKLGIELLARRPDLQAARWRIEASLSRVEAAEAAFYPDVNLTASFGLDTISLSHLLEAASRTLFVGPSVSVPLFDSKRLDARLGTVRAARNALIADYNQAVFDAVREVAQSGAALQGIENQIPQQAAAQQATEALLRSARRKFDQGLADRGTVLAAERAALEQQDASLQLGNQQLLAEVALAKALGGGYRTQAFPTEPAAAGHPDKTEN